MNDPSIIPGADADGFIYISKLRRMSQTLDAAGFLERVSAPALQVLDPEELASPEAKDVHDSGVQLLTERIEGTAILRYLGKVAFIAKRPGNPYPHLISIGRSRTNDITVAVDSVSKVHGYFVRDEDTWGFTDHGSTNGTSLDGQKLDKGKKYLLHDGATLRLGLETSFTYLEPASLYRSLTASG